VNHIERARLLAVALAAIVKGESFNIMYSLGLLIVDLETARRRLLYVFEVPEGTPTGGTWNAAIFL
jgi:hypothetical protein